MTEVLSSQALASCNANAGGPAQDSFEQKRKQHYKVDLRTLKAAAAAEDDEEDKDDEGEKKAAAHAPEVSEQCHWAIGPEAIHGGPKKGEGFAQSTGGGPCPADGAGASAEERGFMPGVSAIPGCEPSQAAADLPGSVPCSGDAAGASAAAEGPPEDRSVAAKKVLTWDEETIAEHDLERGTRQKIEEPNTPWMGSPSGSGRESAIHSLTPVISVDEDSIDLPPAPVSPTAIVEQDVEERLQTWFHKERHRASIQEQWGNDEEGEKRRQMLASCSDQLSPEEKKARDFAEKRKLHYKVDLKAMRAMEESEEDDDSEEDE